MEKKKTIVVIGAGNVLPSTLIASIQNAEGKDVRIISSEDAEKEGVIPKGFQVEPKPLIYQAPPAFELPEIFIDSHQAKNDCKKGWRK